MAEYPDCKPPSCYIMALSPLHTLCPHGSYLITGSTAESPSHVCPFYYRPAWLLATVSAPTVNQPLSLCPPLVEILTWSFLHECLCSSSHSELHLPVSHIVYPLLVATCSQGKRDSVTQGELPLCLLHRRCTNPQLCHKSPYILKVTYIPFAPGREHSYH